MTPEQYQVEANRTESFIDVIEGYNKTRLIHGMLGLISESGEIADTLKRWLYYHQPLDEDNLKEEIGDLLWYIALICNTLGIQMSDCMESNIRKLRKRFPEKFNSELAKEENRDREAEMEVVVLDAEMSEEELMQIRNWEPDELELEEYCKSEGVNEEYKDWEFELLLCAMKVKKYHDRVVELCEMANGIVTTPVFIEDDYHYAGYLEGEAEGLRVARDIADMLDGKDRKQALKMIEQRRVEFLGKDQD